MSIKKPTYTELMTAPHEQFRRWCQGEMAYQYGDLLAAAAICRLNDARSTIESLVADAGDAISDHTAEAVKRVLA